VPRLAVTVLTREEGVFTSSCRLQGEGVGCESVDYGDEVDVYCGDGRKDSVSR
jgi:hypothetical protein